MDTKDDPVAAAIRSRTALLRAKGLVNAKKYDEAYKAALEITDPKLDEEKKKVMWAVAKDHLYHERIEDAIRVYLEHAKTVDVEELALFVKASLEKGALERAMKAMRHMGERSFTEELKKCAEIQLQSKGFENAAMAFRLAGDQNGLQKLIGPLVQLPAHDDQKLNVSQLLLAMECLEFCRDDARLVKLADEWIASTDRVAKRKQQLDKIALAAYETAARLQVAKEGGREDGDEGRFMSRTELKRLMDEADKVPDPSADSGFWNLKKRQEFARELEGGEKPKGGMPN